MSLSFYSPWMRIIAWMVLITFTMLILEPAAVAAQVLHAEYQQAAAQSALAKAAKLAHTLETVEATLSRWQQSLTDNTRQRQTAEMPGVVETLKQQVSALEEQVQADFAAIEDHLRTHHLPEEILQRHRAAVTISQQHAATLLQNLADIEAAKDTAQLRTQIDKTLQHLQPLQTAGKHPEFDPNQLPFSIPKGEVRAPLETEEALQALFPTDSTLPPRSVVRRKPSQPDDSYLAPTEDIQITGDIKALAEELEHNPVKIYNWVHDNIRFIPTYGSIQGSQQTLESRAGNATDTASLLIALLRASGIHSRYAYGTVRIPIAKVMNWVGGVTVPEAAVQLLAQGGIPTTSLIQAGKIAFVKMEQVWVEAWVDFEPSRGAKHKVGDSWIPLDASFKQYQFTEGMDIQGQVPPFDAEEFAKHLTKNAQINEAEGWVSGIDQNYIETTLKNYQSDMETYITQTKPDATVGEVLGTQTIIPSNRPMLAAGLPYFLMAKGNTFKELPSRLRHQFKFSLYANETDRTLDTPALTLARSLPSLAGKRLTLSFEPASERDRQVIESYLPKVPEGQELDPKDLPTSLPGYLIHLKAQLKLDGEIVAESGSFTMGQELRSVTGITRMEGGWLLAQNKPIVGEFYAFGIDGQNISAKQLGAVKNRLEVVKTQLEAQQFEGLTKDGLIGDMLYAAALGYFAANDVNLKILSKAGQAIAYRLPSFGTISTSLDPIYSFGIPRQVEMSGIMVDMDAVINAIQAKDNDSTVTRQTVQQVGMTISALEHRIPELFFTNEAHPGEAVSAVKALAVASAEGQRIYQITSANVGVVNSLNIGQGVKDEIIASVAVGKEATVSESNITVAGWTGVGYIISDPETGAGAYRISGGSNGGVFDPQNSFMMLLDMIAMTLAVGYTLLLLYAYFIPTLFALSLVLLVLYADEFDKNIFLALTGLILGAINFFGFLARLLALTSATVWWAGFIAILIGLYGVYLAFEPYFSQKTEDRGYKFFLVRKFSFSRS